MAVGFFYGGGNQSTRRKLAHISGKLHHINLHQVHLVTSGIKVTICTLCLRRESVRILPMLINTGYYIKFYGIKR